MSSKQPIRADKPGAPGGLAGKPRPDAGTLPDDILGGAFSRLDAEVPLLLLPVRIETRYNLAANPPELRIRIYPDQTHIHADRPSPSDVERELTQDYWRQRYAAKDEAGRKGAWQRFVGTVGSKRAGYLARMLRPTQSKGGTLTFPPKAPPAKPEPARPVLLPRKWLAIGYAGGEQIFRKASLPVASDLRTGPDAAAPSQEVSGGGLKVDEGLAWMIDYGRAVEAGMAITIPLVETAAQARDKVDVLLVVGVVEDMSLQAAGAAFSKLLDVHSRTTGLAFVPQGTPTNNTESVASGWTPEELDLAALEERELKASPEGAAKDFDDNASRLAAALGLADATTLRRLAHGADQEATHARHMRTVLFEAVLGTLMRQLLNVGGQSGVSSSAISAARSWFINQVTGGAPVPTLRIGPQPYGILPVRRAVAKPDLATTAGQVERIVGQLIDTWRESSYLLPTFSSDGGVDSTIATILATQPHPARLFTRQLDEYVPGESESLFHLLYIALMEGVAGAKTETGPEKRDLSGVGAAYRAVYVEHYPGGFTSIDDQIDLWNRIVGELTHNYSGKARDDGLALADQALNLLRIYEERQHPLRWLDLDRFEGVLDEVNTTLVAGNLHTTSSEWGDAGLVQAPNAGPDSTAAKYLTDLARGAAKASPPSPKPLLYQLLEQTLPLAPSAPEAQRRMSDALNGLAAVEPGRLEWLLRETLGLGAHRLDAWATSLASERLDRLRQARPTGLQIGAFGWVTQLEPRKAKRPSEGFIHAPSIAHATTAALLRAGWHAHGTNDPLSPVAVSLTSDRVRAAAWLLDGVRQDQPLGDLLGYRFERSLHDRNVDAEVRPMRQRVLAADGQPDAPPDQPVDGIKLLELFRNKQLGTIAAPVRNALLELEATFDAVNDVGLFEAVHQLAAGNYERASAMLDAISLGTIAPPELRAPVTPRSAVAVEHRVVILLRPDAAPSAGGWKKGIRDGIAPALESWVASLLPPASQVGFSVAQLAGGGAVGRATPLTLAQLDLSALDAIYLVGDDPLVAPAALGTLAAGAAGASGPVQVDTTSTSNAVSLADFTILALEVRRLVETLRPADARDLRPADTRGEADADPTTALNAIEALIREADTLLDQLDDAIDGGRLGDVASAVGRFARLGISSGAAPSDIASATALQELATRRLANVTATAVDPANRRPGLEARLTALLGGRVPVLGQFTLAGAEGGPVVDMRKGPALAADVDDWLDAVSCVHPDVGKLTTVGLLSELLGAGGLALSVGQNPVAPGEGWAATHRPAGPGRLSIVAVSGPGGPPSVGQTACGLFVDQWSESIPSDKQVTGVTFQYDAPSNQPPQGWLLAVTPDGEPWNLKLVTDTLLETLEWSSLRAVCPEDLTDFGRAIPTCFMPGGIRHWPAEASS